MRRRSLARETSRYLAGVAQARHYPASACWRCQVMPGPHKCPARGRWLASYRHRVILAVLIMLTAAVLLAVVA